VPYSNVISRTDAQALIPEQVSQQMLMNLQTESAALSLFTRVPVATNQTRFPVLAALPTAYFVNGDTGLKQTTETNWANKFLNIEEIACIVPIPESVLDDTSFDVWGMVRPLCEQAIGRTLDAAVFFGVNKPSSWPSDIVTAAAASSPANTQARGASTQANGGVAQDLNLLFGKIETDGFTPNGVVARTSFKQIVRGARDTTGQALADLAAGTLWGEPLRFVQAGLWPTAGTGAAEAIAGDFNQGVLGVRQDFTWKVLDQAVIQDGSGAIQYNLAQQDMVALRVVFRVGFQVANTINYEQTTEASRYPFGILTQP
jgi:HK97 family phage major capsid protein